MDANELSRVHLHGVVSTSHGVEKRGMARYLRKRMTDAEKKLWPYLRAHRMCGQQFRRQQVIDGFIVDFYCHVAALVIELDGGVHEQTAEYDRERDAILSARGILIVRYPNELVQTDIEAILADIAQHVKARMSS